MRKGKWIAGAIVVIVLSTLGYWAYWTYLAPVPAAATPTPGAAATSRTPATVSAEGSVVPAYYAELGFDGAGQIAEVLVEQGATVPAGELLARLGDQEQLDAAVAAAELELLTAQQALDDLSTSAGVTAAQAAKAVADGRDAVRDAEWRLDSLKTPASQEDIDAAQAAVTLADKALQRAQKELKRYLNKSLDNPRRAASELLVAVLRKQYDQAVRRLNYMQGTANEITLAQAEADLELAKSQLEDAENRLAGLEDGLDPDQVALAEARLNNAAKQLLAARQASEKLELRAPFDGTIISSQLKTGEYALPGAPLLTLADIRSWRIETTDLAETDVALLHPGMPASIVIDAFPDQAFNGKIASIDLRGEDRRGDVTYTVTIEFDHQGLPLRWGMSAFVEIALP